VERRPVAVPPEFDTVAEVSVRASRPGQPLQAFAVAIGGSARRCFAYLFATRADGPRAPREVGTRLELMVDRSLGGILLESPLAPRLDRQPLPGLPPDATPAGEPKALP
jgi:hypothetical protein